MSEIGKSVYISNAWRNLVTETAHKRFEENGWAVDGNWLNGENITSLHKVILAAPAHFDGALIIYPEDFPESKTFAHLLYPDEMVGWNFQNGTYLKEQQKSFIPLLENSPVLSHSKYTLELAASTYGKSLNQTRQITHLPIEFNKIQKTTSDVSPRGNGKTRVLWNHMWRSDKDVNTALTSVDQLSSTYKEVDFYIGRENSWGSNPDVNSVKNQAQSTLDRLHDKTNVYFQPSFSSKNMVDYWRFLSNFDIGFSVSTQEGFGLSMLEQASAGIACVMPPTGAYPEIHPGGLLTQNVAEGISELIENPVSRRNISESGIENALKFNAEDWADKILIRIS